MTPRSSVFTTVVRRNLLSAIAGLAFLCVSPAVFAQQTLGAINGTVTDSSGAVVQGAAVKARAQATNLEVSAQTKTDGSFNIADLPIGSYEVKFIKEGFDTSDYPHIIVQGNRTTTVNAKLSPGQVTSSVTVNAIPLLNETDTTTGYVLNGAVIENTPLGTGSFTQLATLSPGVSADLLNTSGTNAGFGNQAIWADGQRDTSNSFSFNGVYANNIFNGKSTSQVTSNRVAVNIGESGNSSNNPSGEIVTSTSVYGAIGQSLPSPPPETIQEMRVNSAMYDASQGANSGAHIELITKSGANALHGGAYEYHQTTGWNANEWFFNHAGLAREPLHRNVFGGYVGGPIKKDKLFFFGSYQGQRVSDHLLGISFVAVPPGLTDDRSATGLAKVVDNQFIGPCGGAGLPACFDPATITPQALAIMQAKLANGSFLVPDAATGQQLTTLQTTENADAEIIGPGSRFSADQLNGNVDYLFGAKDRLSTKYYFQRNPNTSPFAQSQLEGFPQTMNAGSQTISIDDASTITPNMTWEQRFGFIRERAFANTSQALSPSAVGINLFGLTKFPEMSIGDADHNGFTLPIGPTSNFANAGVFQNNYELATNLNWVRGRHSISTGMNWDHTQLNVINLNNQLAQVNFNDFPSFLQGVVCSVSNPCGFGLSSSEFLNGSSNRHYRTNQVGAFVQDNLKLKSNLTVNLGLRWDWDGPLTEKDGLLTNFYKQEYSYNVGADTINNIGLVVAGNNKTFGTKGVSASTLTGRQWGFAPRIGVVYSPKLVKNVVIRAGFGMYYDRGEYFTELSPPAGGGISGPFGVTVEEPFVIPFLSPASATFANPFGTTPPPPPPSNLSSVQGLIPNANDIVNQTTPYCMQTNQSFCSGLFFGGYDPKNKLPYSENWTLDLQWQPSNTVVASIAYVGNHGVHGLIPLPFNQARLATQQNPALAGGPFQQIYSYGWNVTSLETLNTLVVGFPAGNAALRAPFLGYDPNSDFNEAIGVSNYDALQVSVDKRISHGLLLKASYTFSHTLDEQSGLGLFFTGNDPNNPRSSYATSDYDRTHVFTVSYHYEFPKLGKLQGWTNQLVNGWGLSGITVLESGQPYSVNDFSGSIANIFYQAQDFVTNPLVPVGGLGSTSTKAVLQGTTGVNANKPVLNVNAFGPPQPFAPGTNGVPPCDPSGACDNFETGFASVNQRNIFRGPFQNRFDFGLFKNFQIKERFVLRYDVQAFNLFNHPSFDIPNNNVEFAPDFQNPPIYGPKSSDPFEQTRAPCVPSTGAFACPPVGNLGVLQHTIGSPRFIQMALHLTF
ncbi:MAG TPA: TonB-dependent receptor [Candidatus Sulfotelmatobacter sp.]|nr:TonB-dependent receptor [Candidatus Sulfotelmatobacter sp.]